MEQVAGGLVQHLVPMLRILFSPALVPQCVVRPSLPQAQVEDELPLEDEFATKCGQFALEHIKGRSVRTL